jgi:CheY-like chemotaxis protein
MQAHISVRIRAIPTEEINSMDQAQTSTAAENTGQDEALRPLTSADGPQHPEYAATNSRSEQAKKFHAQRILLIDDNKDAADGLAAVLELLGQKVWLAHDGPSAIEKISAIQPNIVLCDIGMPGMNGYDVARKLRENLSYADLVLIAVSGSGEKQDRRRSQEAGFNAHFVKPVSVETLQELLNAWSKERRLNGRLLIADDNRDEADVLSMALRHEGFEVEVAHDGGQAVTMALQFKPDVLFVDIAMPVLDGFQVVRCLRAMPNFTNKVFVALTGFSDQEHLDQASNAEFDEYLVKPFSLDSLMTILAEAAG